MMMLCLLLLPLIILIPYFGSFLMRPGSVYSDLLVSHLPNALTIRQSLETWGQIPLWSNNILSGYPFYADPLSGLWYLPAWIGVILPNAAGFNLLFAIHLLWGGMGMYLWLRQEGLRKSSALVGALMFEGMPKIWAHYAAGHVSLIYAVCWTPWLLYAEKRSHQPGSQKVWRTVPGLLMGVMILADVRWIAYAGPLWLVYALAQEWINKSDEGNPPFYKKIASWFGGWTVRAWGRLGVNLVWVVLIAAPLLFPLYQYTQLSTRSSMSASDMLVYSLPPLSLFGLFLPNAAGNVEYTLYPTLLGLLSLVLLIFSTHLRRGNRFWIAIAAVSLVFALGSNIPLMEYLVSLPGLSMLRVPARALFITCFAVVVITAKVMDALLSSSPEEYRIGKVNPIFALVVVLELVWMLAFWMAKSDPEKTFTLAWCSAWGGMACLAMVLRLLRRGSPFFLIVVFIGAAFLEPAVVNRFSFSPTLGLGSTKADQVAGYLNSQGGSFRTYSPSYSIPQQIAVENHLQLADGVDPLQLSAYAGYMEKATGVPIEEYSVTLPPYANGNPDQDNAAYAPDALTLGWLNVRYVVSSYPVQAAGLVLRTRIQDQRIYENLYVYPRAWIQAEVDTITDKITPEERINWSPNKVEVWAKGPGRLVISEIMYPDWTVTIDDTPAQIQTVGTIFRSVDLDEGSHTVVFTIIPKSLYLGFFAAIFSLIIWCAWWLLQTRRREVSE